VDHSVLLPKLLFAKQFPPAVSETGLTSALMMEAETVSETLDYNAILARLIAREDFIAYYQRNLHRGTEKTTKSLRQNSQYPVLRLEHRIC
jgi:hypothetical protein